MGNLIKVMWNAIKARFTRLVTKIRMFTSSGYVRARVLERIRGFFRNVFSVKPRDKDDYYGVFGWLISKKLAFAIVIIIGVVSLLYTYATYPSLFPNRKGGDHVKTYKYNSIMLRIAKGNVRIKGKSGYLAYEGSVSKGSCNGNGTLYNPEGNIVYQGHFTNSMYEDLGTFYYPDGTIHYIGNFHENLFSGDGKLYRENGSLEYEGAFTLGMKEGAGKLFDTGNNIVFDGEFSQDEIKYSALIGMTNEELAKAYLGQVVMYDDGSERVRSMRDISALSVERGDAASVDESYKAATIYVLKDNFRFGGKEYKSISEITGILGQPTYEGVSRATLSEELAIREMGNPGAAFDALPEVTTKSEFTEYTRVTGYDTEYEVYLTSFIKDGLVYNFVTGTGADKDMFSFYYIAQEDRSDVEQ